MKKISFVLFTLFVIVLFLLTGCSKSYGNAIVVPTEFIERIQAFDNDNGEWKKAGFAICSSYFDGIEANNCEIDERSLSANSVQLGNQTGNLTVSILGHPDDIPIEDSFAIYAYTIEPTIISPSDSKVYKDTLKYYQETYKDRISEGDTTWFIDKERRLQVSVMCGEMDSIIATEVGIWPIPSDITDEELEQMIKQSK